MPSAGHIHDHRLETLLFTNAAEPLISPCTVFLCCHNVPEVSFEFLARLRRHLQSGPRRAVYTPISRAEKMCSDEGKTYRCLTSNLSCCPSLLFSSLAWSQFSLFVTFPVMRTRADLLSFQSLSAQYVAQRAACGRLGMTFGSGLLISLGNKTRDNMPSSASGDRNGRRGWNSTRCGLEVLVVRPKFLHPEDEPGRRIKACPKATKKKKDTKKKHKKRRHGWEPASLDDVLAAVPQDEQDVPRRRHEHLESVSP